MCVVAKLEEGNPSQLPSPEVVPQAGSMRMDAILLLLRVAQGSCAFLKALYFSTWGQQDHFSFSSVLGRMMVLIYVSGILLRSEVCHFQIWLPPSTTFHAVCLPCQLVRCIRFRRRLWAQGIVKPPNGRTLSLNEQRPLFLTSSALDHWTVTWVRKKKKTS